MPPPWVPINLSLLAQRLASCSLSVVTPVAQTVTSAPLTTSAEEEESPAEGGMEPDTRARTPATPPAGVASSTTPFTPQRKYPHQVGGWALMVMLSRLGRL